jgi:hypothetical protein
MSTGQTVIGFRSLDQSARQGFRVKLPEPDPIRSISLKATLLASGWTAGSDGRYQQTVTAEGVAEDTAVVIVQGAMRGIDPEVTQGDNSLTFYCDALPIANIEIKIGIPV